MALEDDALLASLLATGHGSDCAIDPDASPAGATVRVLFSAPFLGVDVQTGDYANTKPEAQARASDVASVVKEQTVLRIEGTDYVAERIERVEGSSAWRTLLLREA